MPSLPASSNTTSMSRSPPAWRDIVDELRIVGRGGFHEHDFVAAGLRCWAVAGKLPAEIDGALLGIGNEAQCRAPAPARSRPNTGCAARSPRAAAAGVVACVFHFLAHNHPYSVCSPFISFTKLLTESVSHRTRRASTPFSQLTFGHTERPGIRSLVAPQLDLSTGAAPMAAGTARNAQVQRLCPLGTGTAWRQARRDRTEARGSGNGTPCHSVNVRWAGEAWEAAMKCRRPAAVFIAADRRRTAGGRAAPAASSEY